MQQSKWLAQQCQYIEQDEGCLSPSLDAPEGSTTLKSENRLSLLVVEKRLMISTS